MNTKTKRISIAGLGAVCALSLAAGAGVLAAGNAKPAFAETNSVPTSVYYYDNLKDTNGKEYTLAKKFYNALDSMNKSGDFKDGVVEYSLKDIVTSDEIKAWVEDGDLTVPKAFSAARDSYFYDHPELFYIDIYKLTISAGRSNGVYSAFIDSGREANCYIDGGFASLSEVETAIGKFDAKINEITKYAKEEAAKEEKYGTAKEVLLATYANTYIAENVKYDYAAYGEYLEDSTTADVASYSYSAYGSLVLGTSVCSGFARGYKAVLDKLGVPCIIVSGNSIKMSGDGSAIDKGEAHSWNYVWYADPTEEDETGITPASASSYSARANVKGAWYAFDVTWNSARSNANSYINMSAFATSRNHATDPVVSSSGYIMPYPALSLNNYGNTTITNEFMHSYAYTRDTSGGNDANGLDDYGNPFMTKTETVSYKGKGALELLDEQLYIIYRSYYDDGKGGMLWTNWNSLGHLSEIVPIDKGTETIVPLAANALYSQFAVVDVEADLDYFGSPVASKDDRPISYSPDYKAPDGKDLGEHTLYISEIFVNKTYGTYTPAPYITKTNPKHTERLVISDNMAISADNPIMADKYTFTLSVTYDEKLHVIDESKPIGINFLGEFNNIYEYAFLVPFSGNEYVKLSDDGYTLTFKFKPSLMYEHNSVLYSFYFENVGSTKILAGKMSNKAPNPVYYHFARDYMTCPMILGGGRLWIDCCAQPTLVSNSDLAAMDFKDEEGNSTFSENARSQMMLVVESVSEATENTMLNEINEEFGVESKDIKKSSTYDINLQICGKYPTIADGSYVKIALGFPEGYGPEDEGVTFKLYHRKHIQGDEYIIEEVPCVVTRLGIVATVTSFSPYMVAAVDADKVTDNNKYIYATIEGKGGTLSKEDGQIKTVENGKNVTFAITPDEGYKIYSVTLNNKDVTDKIVNGVLTLNYSEIDANSEVEIKYIANAAALRYVENGIEEPVKVVVSTEGGAEAVEGTGGKVDIDISDIEIPDVNKPDDNKPGNSGDANTGDDGDKKPGNTDEGNKSKLGCNGTVSAAGTFAFVTVVLAAVAAIRLIVKRRLNSAKEDKQ